MSQAQQQTPTATGAPPAHTNRGIVKQVLSGDVLVIRGQPRNGPPPEKTLALSNVTTPKLARRANPNVEKSVDTKDEPFAWEAREFLRKLVIGKEVIFTVENKVPSTNREYGSAWLTVNGEHQNITDTLVSEGLVEVRTTARQSDEIQRLSALEATAKASSKGRWNKEKGQKTIRDIVWTMSNDDLRTFVERNHNKEMDAVVEHLRDGSTMRVMLVPSFHQLTVAMSGIKCPMIKRDGDKENPEPFAEEAKYFTEARLLQRDVKVVLEGVSNQLVLATVLHPAGNIAELLLKLGFARCVDWSMAFVSKGRDKLRAAEREAKQKQLHLWKGYTPAATPEISTKTKNFTGKVVEIGNGDNLVVKSGENTFQKIFFSSLRPPRQQQPKDDDAPPSSTQKRPLYDIPHMFEAREFMRKKLIGKKVNVTVDYIKPAQDNFPAKTCCTVTRENVNIAEALISKGLATCLRHRQDDDQRSSCYDDLLAAEARANKNNKGVHTKKDAPIHRVADVSQDTARAKQFLPFLQRAGKTIALVEFVASGGRAKLYLPKDTCLINFILAGVSCPRAPNTRDGSSSGEPFGQDALTFTKELIMHREVEVEVEAVDKGGNFIGWLYSEGKNLSVMLVEEGLSKVLPQAERSSHGKSLFDAEEKAKVAKKNLWKDFVEPVNEDSGTTEESEVTTPTTTTTTASEEPPAPAERKTNFQKVVVTEVESANHFWAQSVENGPKFEQLMEQLRSDITANPPLAGSFKPTKGSLCVAKFSDDQWYRAKVERTEGNIVHLLFIDFGNRQVTPTTNIAAIPAAYSGTAPQAKEYFLACVIAPDDEDWSKEALGYFCSEVMDKVMMLNVEYKNLGQEFVSVQQEGVDIAKKMLSEGLLRVERRRDRRLAKLVGGYVQAEEEARKKRRNIWCYGDFTPDDAREFGYQK